MNVPNIPGLSSMGESFAITLPVVSVTAVPPSPGYTPTPSSSIASSSSTAPLQLAVADLQKLAEAVVMTVYQNTSQNGDPPNLITTSRTVRVPLKGQYSQHSTFTSIAKGPSNSVMESLPPHLGGTNRVHG